MYGCQYVPHPSPNFNKDNISCSNLSKLPFQLCSRPFLHPDHRLEPQVSLSDLGIPRTGSAEIL